MNNVFLSVLQPMPLRSVLSVTVILVPVGALSEQTYSRGSNPTPLQQAWLPGVSAVFLKWGFEAPLEAEQHLVSASVT